jgi:hypothetical protein
MPGSCILPEETSRRRSSGRVGAARTMQWPARMDRLDETWKPLVTIVALWLAAAALGAVTGSELRRDEVEVARSERQALAAEVERMHALLDLAYAKTRECVASHDPRR